eukprot:5594192-Lingulodinium_polyedra.AAC.1
MCERRLDRRLPSIKQKQRAVAAADGRLDRIVGQRFANVAQRCGRIDCAPPQRLVDRTLARSMCAPENWCARG